MLRDYSDREHKLSQFHTSRSNSLRLAKESLVNNLVREDLIPVRLWGNVNIGVEIALCEYSLGYPFSKIKATIEAAIEDYTKTPDTDAGHASNSYILIRLVSMAVLTDVDERHWTLLINKWKGSGEYGKFVGILLRYRTPTISAKHQVFVDERWESLLNTFKVEESVELENQLKAYLKKWYVRSRSVSWYNAHTREDINAYFGYWSCEAAAVAKVRGIELTGTTFGEYFPYSFFNLPEQLSKAKVKKAIPKPKPKPKKLSATRVAYPKLPKLTFDIGTIWINESQDRLGLITHNEELECAGTVYASEDGKFETFAQTRHNTLLKQMPWYKLVGDSKIRELPIGIVNEQLMQGVWQGETEPTSYLVYALSFDKYFMGLTFTFMAKEQKKYLPMIESLLASIRYE